jgi:hypothetical protein
VVSASLESIFLISFIWLKPFPEIRIKRLSAKIFLSSSLFIEWLKVIIISLEFDFNRGG